MDNTPAPPTRGQLITVWMLRVTFVLILAGVLLQPVLAGRFLSGDVDSFWLHEIVGLLTAGLSLVVVLLAIGYALVVRGRLWVIGAAVLLFVGFYLQLTLGYVRTLDVHVPLGVAMLLATGAFTRWSWVSAATPRTRPVPTSELEDVR